MYYEMLLKLAPQISNDQLEVLDKYLGEEIALRATGNIMVPGLARKLNVPITDAVCMMEKCASIGVVEKRFLLKCPNCRSPIRTIKTSELAQVLKDLHCCTKCENEDMTIDTDDLEVYYALIANKPSFPSGQQDHQARDMETACKPTLLADEQGRMDLQGFSLKDYFAAGYDINEAFYSPSEEEYKALESMYTLVQAQAPNSTEKGARLERLIIKIFALSKEFSVFTASGSAHQIDVLPARKCSIQTVTTMLGSNFVIECKNERSVPKTDYFTKLHSRVLEFRTPDSHDSFKTGILVSRVSAPDTYLPWAALNYGKHDIFILSMSDEHIKRIVYQRENLYSILHELMLMVQTGLGKIKAG